MLHTVSMIFIQCPMVTPTCTFRKETISSRQNCNYHSFPRVKDTGCMHTGILSQLAFPSQKSSSILSNIGARAVTIGTISPLRCGSSMGIHWNWKQCLVREIPNHGGTCFHRRVLWLHHGWWNATIHLLLAIPSRLGTRFFSFNFLALERTFATVGCDWTTNRVTFSRYPPRLSLHCRYSVLFQVAAKNFWRYFKLQRD